MKEIVPIVFSFFISNLVTFAHTLSPYPVEITLPSENPNLTPRLFDYYSYKILMTSLGAVRILEANDHTFTSENFTSYFPNNAAKSYPGTPDIIRVTVPDGSYRYLFSNIGKSFFIMKNDPPEITALDTGTFTRIDAMASYSIINETTMILSLPFQNTNSKTKLSFFDYNLEIKGAYLSLNESFSDTYFDCQYSHKLDIIFCIFSKETNEIFVQEFNIQTISYGGRYTLTTLDDASQIIEGIVFVEATNDAFFGIAWIKPDDYLYAFKCDITDRNVVFSKMVKTDLPQQILAGMTVHKVFDDFIMVTNNITAGEGEGCVSFYNSNLEKLSIDGKNFGGYNFFVATLSDLFYEFVSQKRSSPTTFFYTRHEKIQCQDMSYELEKDETFLIDYNDIMTISLEYPDDNNGIRFLKENTYDIGGTLIEIDTDNSEQSAVSFNDNTIFYKKVKYKATKPGNFIIRYTLINIVNNALYIPSQLCTITIKNKWYHSCEVASDFGDDTNHNCISCTDYYYFVENSSNCYHSPPVGYFLDTSSTPWIYKACASTCSVCLSPTQCLVCNENYSLMSYYSQNKADSYCIETCSSITSRWYFDKDTNDFICLVGQTYCPAEYSCYNANRNQCKLSTSTDCAIEIAQSVQEESEIFDYFDSYILSYYKTRYVSNTETYTACTYDTSTTSNEATGLTNLTQIEFGQCESLLKTIYGISESDDLIVAQVETKVDNSAVNKVSYSLYSKSGIKLNLTYCEGIEITMYSPINNVTTITMTLDQIVYLFSLGVDVFDSTNNFFNDKCFSFTSEKGTDVAIKDRRADYYQNVTLCNEGCEYNGIILENFTANCTCTASTKDTTEEENIINSFKSITNANYEVARCYKAVFNKNNIKTNIGSYILIAFFVIHTVNFIFFVMKRKDAYAKYIFTAPKAHPHSKNSHLHIGVKHNVESSSTLPVNFDKETEARDSSPFNDQGLTTNNALSIKEEEQELASTPQNTSVHKGKHAEEDAKLINVVTVNKKTENNKKEHSDYYYDNLDLKEAMEEDKRSFFHLLKIRIKDLHPIFYACCNQPNRSVKYVSIGVMLFGLETDLVLNAFFYSDYYISHSYQNEGKYDILTQIPKTLYSSFSGYLLGIFCNLLAKNFPNEEDFECSDRSKSEELKEKVSMHIKRLHYGFFVLLFIFILFYWYYITAFCAVYQNSQIGWLLDSLMSFLVSMVLPFLVAFLCVVLRKIALKTENEKCLFAAKLLE